MTDRKPVDGAAPEVQAELDRIWMTLDGLTRQLYESGLDAARAGRMPPVVQQLAAKPCSCDEALELRAKLKEAERQRDEALEALERVRIVCEDGDIEDVCLRREVEQAAFIPRKHTAQRLAVDAFKSEQASIREAEERVVESAIQWSDGCDADEPEADALTRLAGAVGCLKFARRGVGFPPVPGNPGPFEDG